MSLRSLSWVTSLKPSRAIRSSLQIERTVRKRPISSLVPEYFAASKVLFSLHERNITLYPIQLLGAKSDSSYLENLMLYSSKTLYTLEVYTVAEYYLSYKEF